MLLALLLGGCASPRTLRAFSSDGCSLFPEGDAGDASRWSGCCLDHDQAYWRGGTAVQRRQADLALRACVLARTGRPLLAAVMHRGVRIGGAPSLPTSFRWAYGWAYGRSYAPLTAAEERQAEGQWTAYVLSHPPSDCEQHSE